MNRPATLSRAVTHSTPWHIFIISLGVTCMFCNACRTSSEKSPPATPASKPAASQPTASARIYIGMKLDTAAALLGSHDWNESVFQIAYPALPDNLQFFRDKKGNHLELRSRQNNRQELYITYIAISTYQEKSSKPKSHPEHDRIYKSFKSIDELDLDRPTENQLPATPTKAPP